MAATAAAPAAAPAATSEVPPLTDDDSIVPPVLTGKEVPYLDQTISFRGNEVFDQYGCAVMMNWENDVMVRASCNCTKRVFTIYNWLPYACTFANTHRQYLKHAKRSPQFIDATRFKAQHF